MFLQEFPMLYAKNKNGVWKQWKVKVRMTNNNTPIIETSYGQVGGKLVMDQLSVLQKKRGYETLWEQAIALAQSKWNHKHHREHYQEVMSDAPSTVAPMLAKTFDQGKHLTFPLYIQPKIDGLRCLASWDGTRVCLLSRTGCPFSHLDEIRNELRTYFETKGKDCVLDGELYSDEISFEELSGYCRKKEQTEKKHIHYHVFDVVTSMNMSFEKRLMFFPSMTDHVHCVATIEIQTMDQVQQYLSTFIEQGYEGLILRNKDGLYRNGYRSWDLQKYKLFQEEEFIITGFTEGTGREKGTIIWQCQTPQHKIFHVRPKGSMEQRREMFNEGEKYIGKKMTVIFQEYTTDGIPRFPVAKAIREDY